MVKINTTPPEDEEAYRMGGPHCRHVFSQRCFICFYLDLHVSIHLFIFNKLLIFMDSHYVAIPSFPTSPYYRLAPLTRFWGIRYHLACFNYIVPPGLGIHQLKGYSIKPVHPQASSFQVTLNHSPPKPTWPNSAYALWVHLIRPALLFRFRRWQPQIGYRLLSELWKKRGKIPRCVKWKEKK